ncbi:helix-turn-helix domain-containing protein [Halococcus dombrowskii]|uniref:Helix-turn-helix domain-containing protein n=2 Tax=Halococcus dombrowskii TaxID=179637 RepID=A0AAV3SEF6_HALDO
MFQQSQYQFMSSGTIDIDEFENADADEFNERNDTERIVLFLDTNEDRAWKAATIAERLGLKTDAVSAILSRLKERELVRHKRPYWAITDDEERLQSAYRLHRHHEAADDQYGEERLDDLQTEEMDEIQ